MCRSSRARTRLLGPGALATLAFGALAACGRVGFATTGGATGDSGSNTGDGSTSGDGALRDDAAPTGANGPRYLIELDANASAPVIAGTSGAVAVLETFQGATTIAGTAFTGHAMYVSGAVLWLDPTGAPMSSSVLDETSECALRDLGPAGTRGVIAVGYAEGTATASDGACAVSSGRQSGIAVTVAPTGAQSLVANVLPSTFNIQTWSAIGFDDGTALIDGVYGGSGSIGSTVLATTTSDENPYYARVDPATGQATWASAVVSADELTAGPIDVNGDDACVTGSYDGSVTAFGSAITTAGGLDDWIARVDGSGNARWVRSIGTTADEPTNGMSIVATSDGGCTYALQEPGDLTIDGMTFPAAQGTGLVLRFDATGMVAAGARVPAGLQLARLGDTAFGAVECAAPCPIGTLDYVPVGAGIAIVSFDAAMHASDVAQLNGGAVSLFAFAASSPDALALTFSSGPTTTTFGSLSLPSAAAVNALAVLGVDP